MLLRLNEFLDKKVVDERPELEEFFRNKNIPASEINSRIAKYRITLYEDILNGFHTMSKEEMDILVKDSLEQAEKAVKEAEEVKRVTTNRPK